MARRSDRTPHVQKLDRCFASENGSGSTRNETRGKRKQDLRRAGKIGLFKHLTAGSRSERTVALKSVVVSAC